MKEIKLSQGKSAIVDDADSDLDDVRWCFHKGYANRGPCRKTFGKKLWLHHVVISRVIGRDIMPGEEVDHIDGNKLNNTRGNLRIASNAENKMNRDKQSNNTSGYKGVSFHKKYKKWRAIIGIQGKSIHLGYFSDAVEAAKAYDDSARKYHGEFARTNF